MLDYSFCFFEKSFRSFCNPYQMFKRRYMFALLQRCQERLSQVRDERKECEARPEKGETGTMKASATDVRE